jgi:hypothetical protein
MMGASPAAGPIAENAHFTRGVPPDAAPLVRMLHSGEGRRRQPKRRYSLDTLIGSST